MTRPIPPQTIRTAAGEELVVITRADYERLVEAAEEAADVAMFDQRMQELSAGRDAPLPPEVSIAILKGDRLLKALRKWRGLTQTVVAARAGIGQAYLSDLESGRRSGTPAVLRKLAGALKVDRRWLGA